MGATGDERERSGAGNADAGVPAADLLESLRQIGATGRAGLGAGGDAAKALRTLLAADVSLARSAIGRALALTGVAIAFGASCWLLLMTALISFLNRQVGLSWSLSLLLCALLSGAVTAWAVWQAQRYFEHTRLQATRRQLARLGIGELADFMPDADAPVSSRDAAQRTPAARDDGTPLKDDLGVDVTPP